MIALDIALDIVIIALLAAGTAFVAVGTVGLLRFPDLATRLHAVAKADNLGLGLIVAALVVHVLREASAPDDPAGWGVALKLLLIWLLALLGTAANSHLLAVPPPGKTDGKGKERGEGGRR
ncbi:cation:proton antiporter [Sediminivirga luteola]|uniref:Cation:proton antiporter n=1 Tax=Sediminivirga luteola TaxID=1774748 RepID=A0A8J2XLP7_9MICO|nr:monovalent cation/H(+) antiporter subunit G [Sediminivirga luteola]GGA24592.1 cation:proton antiporter [Sediminivirga luteola]